MLTTEQTEKPVSVCQLYERYEPDVHSASYGYSNGKWTVCPDKTSIKFCPQDDPCKRYDILLLKIVSDDG